MPDVAENDTTAATAVRRRSFWRRRVVLPLLLILGLAFVAFWIQREDIADNVIGGYFRSHHVQATYRIERIGGTRVWVLPNPSGLNAHFPLPKLAKVFRDLRDAVT